MCVCILEENLNCNHVHGNSHLTTQPEIRSTHWHDFIPKVHALWDRLVWWLQNTQLTLKQQIEAVGPIFYSSFFHVITTVPNFEPAHSKIDFHHGHLYRKEHGGSPTPAGNTDNLAHSNPTADPNVMHAARQILYQHTPQATHMQYKWRWKPSLSLNGYALQSLAT